jgi:hypothetical protein
MKTIEQKLQETNITMRSPTLGSTPNRIQMRQSRHGSPEYISCRRSWGEGGYRTTHIEFSGRGIEILIPVKLLPEGVINIDNLSESSKLNTAIAKAMETAIADPNIFTGFLEQWIRE